jgi:hypothetical protein
MKNIVNQCQENEYRCKNGQCISQLFHRDDPIIPDCLDGSDEILILNNPLPTCYRHENPIMKCEDRTCQHEGLTSSCVMNREDILKKMMYSSKDSFISDDCWSAFQSLRFWIYTMQ